MSWANSFSCFFRLVEAKYLSLATKRLTNTHRKWYRWGDFPGQLREVYLTIPVLVLLKILSLVPVVIDWTSPYHWALPSSYLLPHSPHSWLEGIISEVRERKLGGKVLWLFTKERIQQNYNKEGALVAPTALVGNGPKGRRLAQQRYLYIAMIFPNPRAPAWENTCPAIFCLTRVHLASKTLPVKLGKTLHKGQGTTIL